MNVRDVLHQIVDYCREPAWLVELYYWSFEPGLKRTMRQYLSLPKDVRATLQAFFLMAEENPASVSVLIGKDGEVTLASPCVAEARRHLTASVESEVVH